MAIAFWILAAPFAGGASEDAHAPKDELQAIDAQLQSLQDQEKSGQYQKVPQSLVRLVYGHIQASLLSLYVDHETSANSGRPDTLDYYKTHPWVLEKLLLKERFGEERNLIFQRIFANRLLRGDKAIKIEAMWWLAHCVSGPDSLKELRNQLGNEDFELRFEAARLLAEGRDAGGKSVLLEALSTSDDAILMAAVKALHYLGIDKGIERVREIARSTSTAIVAFFRRERALSTLGTIGDSGSIDILRSALESDNLTLARTALTAMQDLSSRFDLTPHDYQSIGKLLDHPRADSLIKLTAFALLAEKTGETQRSTLLRYRNHLDPEMRVGMLRGMIRNGRRSDINWIMDYLGDSHQSVRRMAESAIWQISDVKLGDFRTDLEGTIKKRRVWWESHKHDPEYQ